MRFGISERMDYGQEDALEAPPLPKERAGIAEAGSSKKLRNPSRRKLLKAEARS
jgi:hypothetical protein